LSRRIDCGSLKPGEPPAPAANVALVVSGALSRTTVQAIQSRLQDLDFYNGPMDGIWGAATQRDRAVSAGTGFAG
jgi:peptidoglycan hydrolase-like protein with peptidoglycan-binding domain